MSSRSSRTIYVGNLPGDAREREIDDIFHKYGPIVDIDLKLPPRPPGYCFIEFEDIRDAEDAIRGRDGYNFDGYRLRVEMAHGGRGLPSADRRSSADRYHGGGRGGGVSRRSEYRVIITGLPSSASWQDLKDHMRRAGDVCFAQVFREGNGTTGIVDFTNYEDMRYAIKKLDDSEFRNPFSRSYIRVKEDRSQGFKRSPSRSYSRSRSRNRSRSYSPSRSRSHSHSRGRSPRSRSKSRSVSKTPARFRRSPRSRSKSRSASKSPARLRRSPRSTSNLRSPSKSPTRLRRSPRSRSKSRSPSKSPTRLRSKSRSPRNSRSPVKDLSRSPSPRHSRSRSPSHSPVNDKSPTKNGNGSRSRSRSPTSKAEANGGSPVPRSPSPVSDGE